MKKSTIAAIIILFILILLLISGKTKDILEFFEIEEKKTAVTFKYNTNTNNLILIKKKFSILITSFLKKPSSIICNQPYTGSFLLNENFSAIEEAFYHNISGRILNFSNCYIK